MGARVTPGKRAPHLDAMARRGASADRPQAGDETSGRRGGRHAAAENVRAEGGPPSPSALLHHLDEAEQKAWLSLCRYKFQMFGYWAAIWVHLNRIGKFRRANPFRDLVTSARRGRIW